MQGPRQTIQTYNIHEAGQHIVLIYVKYVVEMAAAESPVKINQKQRNI